MNYSVEKMFNAWFSDNFYKCNVLSSELEGDVIRFKYHNWKREEDESDFVNIWTVVAWIYDRTKEKGKE